MIVTVLKTNFQFWIHQDIIAVDLCVYMYRYSYTQKRISRWGGKIVINFTLNIYTKFLKWIPKYNYSYTCPLVYDFLSLPSPLKENSYLYNESVISNKIIIICALNSISNVPTEKFMGEWDFSVSSNFPLRTALKPFFSWN